MIIYLANIAFIIFWAFLLLYSNPTKFKRGVFCGISAIQWILISGLRAWDVGADTMRYANSFIRAGSLSWETVFKSMYRVYIEGYQPIFSSEHFLYKDPGYLLFQRVCHVFTHDYQVFLLIIAVILFVTMARFIYKHSDDPCLSFLIFSTLFYTFFAITGHRQTLATALVLFVGFDFIKERKLIPFLLVSTVAYLLHKSAIVFVPFYLLGAKKISWPYLGIIGAITVAVYAAGPSFILEAAEMIGYNREDVYELPPYVYVLALSLVGVVTAVFHKRILAISESKKWEIAATVFATMFGIFALLDQSMMRVQQYYSLFMMLSIPSLFGLFEGESRAFIKFLFVCVMIAYLIMNNPQYSFFWQ